MTLWEGRHILIYKKVQPGTPNIRKSCKGKAEKGGKRRKKAARVYD